MGLIFPLIFRHPVCLCLAASRQGCGYIAAMAVLACHFRRGEEQVLGFMDFRSWTRTLKERSLFVLWPGVSGH